VVGTNTCDNQSVATKYTREVLQEAVDNSTSVMGVIRYLGLQQAGGTHTHIKSKLRSLGVDTSHFTGGSHNRGKTSPRRKTASAILVVRPPGSARLPAAQLRRALEESGVVPVCSCGVGRVWNGIPIQLEVDHIDGDWLNNLKENLRFMCPNCHSQQSTNKSWKTKRSGVE